MDYFVFGKKVYIKSNNNGFIAYDYNNNIVNTFSFDIKDNCILFYSSETDYDSIVLMSEILYFMGNKQKYVVYKNNKMINVDYFTKVEDSYIKTLDSFEKERQKKFDSINELYGYPELVPWNLVEREHDVLELVEKYIPTNANILEIGSGYGKNLLLLSESGYKFVSGIEFSQNAVEISKRLLNNNLLGDVTNTNFADEEYDAIIDIGCLHCVKTEDKINALNEVSRILKRGGLIISRYFLPKNADWLHKFPLNVKSFGSEYDELIDFFKCFDIIESFVFNECAYIVGRKK